MRWFKQVNILLALYLLLAAISFGESDDNRALSEAQKRNQDAQAKYYEWQVNRGIFEKLTDNPAAVAAFLAALVAFITFYFNYRITQRNQADTQFYEALKRFGDKDSAAVRSSAVATLAQMAKMEGRDINPLRPVSGLKSKKRRYCDTSYIQLIMGLLFEKNQYNLLQIRDALYQIIDQIRDGESEVITYALDNANRRLQTEVLTALADFLVANSAARTTDTEDVKSDIWEDAPASLYQPAVFKILADQQASLFSHLVSESLLKYVTLTEKQRPKNLATTYQNLALATYRMYLIVDIFCRALRTSGSIRTLKREYPLFLVNANLVGADIAEVNLRNALLIGAKFNKANLRGAKMQGAKLEGADLDGTCLYCAFIDKDTDLHNVEWWRANFFHENGTYIDRKIIRELAENYPEPAGASGIHESVTAYKRSRGEGVTVSGTYPEQLEKPAALP